MNKVAIKKTQGTVRKSARRSRGKRSLPLSYVPVQARRAHIVYSQIYQDTEGAAGTGFFRFLRLNGAYDVDTSLGSTAVPGFAEYATLYANYRVLRTRVRVEGFITAGSSGSTQVVALVPNTTSTSLPASVNTWVVQPGCAHTTVSPVSNGGSNKVVLDRTYDLPSLMKLDRRSYMLDMDYSAGVSTVPTKQIYCAVTGRSIGSAVPATLSYTLWVAMDIEFFNPFLLNV